MIGICPNCEKEANISTVTKVETIVIRGEAIEVEAHYFQCAECGAEFENTRGPDALEEAYRQYRLRHEMLQPEDIRAWRNSYGITQKELSALLGWGGATLSRYENGALQDESHEKMLRMAMEPHNLLQLIKETPQAFIPEKRERLLRLLEEAEAETISINRLFEDRLGNYPPDEFSGYLKLNLAKLHNAILFFCKGGQLKTKLNKLLFYADFKHFKENAVSITGARYAHLQHGPVPDNYEFFFATLTHSGQIEVDEVQVFQYFGENFVSTVEPDLSMFEPSELKALAEVKELFNAFTASRIREFSHAERGYKETPNHSLISYSFADALQI
ncbi:MAG: type II TA system antitoxin MqsA family protein [Desulfobulbaceae bacterium]